MGACADPGPRAGRRARHRGEAARRPRRGGAGLTEAARLEPAPAKLNLDLYVEGRREDGYHLIDSVVAFLRFGDELEVRLSAGDDDVVSLDGPLAPTLETAGETLVGRALAGLRQLAGSEQRFDVRLTKRIPLAAGLGGGSADAAAALRAGAGLLGVDLSDPALDRLAMELGADVPACLRSEPARMRGIGEVLAPAPTLPTLPLVLANPGVPAPTAAVYRSLDPTRFAPAPPRLGDGALPAWLIEGRNDLEAAAINVAPAIRRVRDTLRATGAPVVRLCGSGATVFAAFAADDEAARAATAVRRAEPSWWVQVTAVR